MKQFVLIAVLVFGFMTMGFMTMVASDLNKWSCPSGGPEPDPPDTFRIPRLPFDSLFPIVLIPIVEKLPVPCDAVYDSKKK